MNSTLITCHSFNRTQVDPQASLRQTLTGLGFKIMTDDKHLFPTFLMLWHPSHRGTQPVYSDASSKHGITATEMASDKILAITVSLLTFSVPFL